MNVNEIVQQLKQQRTRLDAAIQALDPVEGEGKAAEGLREAPTK